MLSKLNRFHGHGSVRRAYRQGRSVRSAIGSLHYYGGVEIKKTKVAVVVSRKVDKSAVHRNRIRRRVYEQVRLAMPHFKHATELIFTVYLPETAIMPSESLHNEVQQLLKRANVL